MEGYEEKSAYTQEANRDRVNRGENKREDRSDAIKVDIDFILSISNVPDKYKHKDDVLTVVGYQTGVYTGKLYKDANKVKWIKEPMLYVKVNPKYVLKNKSVIEG